MSSSDTDSVVSSLRSSVAGSEQRQMGGMMMMIGALLLLTLTAILFWNLYPAVPPMYRHQHVCKRYVRAPDDEDEDWEDFDTVAAKPAAAKPAAAKPAAAKPAAATPLQINPQTQGLNQNAGVSNQGQQRIADAVQRIQQQRRLPKPPALPAPAAAASSRPAEGYTSGGEVVADKKKKRGVDDVGIVRTVAL